MTGQALLSHPPHLCRKGLAGSFTQDIGKALQSLRRRRVLKPRRVSAIHGGDNVFNRSAKGLVRPLHLNASIHQLSNRRATA